MALHRGVAEAPLCNSSLAQDLTEPVGQLYTGKNETHGIERDRYQATLRFTRYGDGKGHLRCARAPIFIILIHGVHFLHPISGSAHVDLWPSVWTEACTYGW